METFDVCVLVFTGLTTGIVIGLALRNKQLRNVQDELDFLDRRYNNLVDSYAECITELYSLKLQNNLKPAPVVKKKAGRPKGSTNKTKKDGGSTTRKYTRKSSK